MTYQFMSAHQVAEHLGVKAYRIKYAHAVGLVAEPLRVANHRLYTEQDVQRLAIYFAEKGGGDGPSVQPGR